MPAADGVDFEFTYRWASMAPKGIVDSVDELEARDLDLELYLHGLAVCGEGEGLESLGDFQYTYRWPQIIQAADPATQIAMLEARTFDMELFFYIDGRCPLQLPYRWDQFWEALLVAEPWAIACAEENDRAIEELFAGCECEPIVVGGVSSVAFSGFTQRDTLYTGSYTFTEDTPITSSGINNPGIEAEINIYKDGVLHTTIGPVLGPSTGDLGTWLTGEEITVTLYRPGAFPGITFFTTYTFTTFSPSAAFPVDIPWT